MNKQTQEALKMAIEDAMKFVNTLNGYEDANQSKPFKTEADKYLSYASVVIKSLATSLQEALAQPAQEPVAWMSKKRGDVSKAKMYFNEGEEILPLYTHPAPSWQGLSDDDVHNYADHNFAFASEHFEEIFNFYRAIEQALKEKNNA